MTEGMEMTEAEQEYVSDFHVEPPHKRNTHRWRVYLPHQCQEWDISWGDNRYQAIRDLEQFLADGQKALDALRRGEAYNWSEDD